MYGKIFWKKLLLALLPMLAGISLSMVMAVNGILIADPCEDPDRVVPVPMCWMDLPNP